MASRLVPGSFGAHVERADVLRRLLPNGSRWRSASGQLRFSLVMILHLRFLALMFRRAFLKIGPRLQRAEAERAAKRPRTDRARPEREAEQARRRSETERIDAEAGRLLAAAQAGSVAKVSSAIKQGAHVDTGERR